MPQQTPRHRLQDRASLLLTLSSMLPAVLFLVFGFVFLNSLFLKKDVNNLKYFAQTMNQSEEKRLDECLQTQKAVVKKIRSPKTPDEARRILDNFRRDNEGVEEYYAMWNNQEIHSHFRVSNEQLTMLRRQVTSVPENAGYILLDGNRHILAYTRLDSTRFNNGVVVVLWKYTMPENLYVSSLIKFATIRIDNEHLLEASSQRANRLRDMFLKISDADDGIYIRRDPNAELTSLYFIRDIFGQPIAIQSMTIERFFIQQLRMSFLIGGLLIAFCSIMTSIFFSRRAASYLVTPMERLSRQMNRIASNPVHSDEIPARNYPTLQVVVSSFNGILSSFKEYYESVQKYETIVKNIHEGIFWADNAGNLLISNRAFTSIFGENKPALSLTDLFRWPANEFALRAADLVNGREVVLGEHTYLIFVNEMTVNDQPNYLGVISDITPQKDAEHAQRQLQLQLSKAQELASIGLLIEGISHNLNGPLHNILGYVQLLQEVYPDSSDLKKIRQNGLRMAEIIKSLMDRMSQVVVFAPRPVDINELVKLELDFFEHNLTFKNMVQKEVCFGENLPKIIVVYSDISQSVSNLISNAIDAVDEVEEKRISVRTEITDKGLRVSVSDNGVGVPRERLEKIFEPFYSSKKLDNRTGRGLGLSVSKQLLDAYGAWIEVESTVGQGSCFSIYFPPKIFAREGDDGLLPVNEDPPEI